MDTKDIITTIASIAALIISITGMFINRRQWRVTNRPFVVARLINPKAGNVGTPYELQILNIGTRPALNIRLETDMNALDSALNKLSQHPPTDVRSCFSPSMKIGLLIPSESITSAFGFNSGKNEDSTWNLGSALPLTIYYNDINGEKFKTRGNIIINTQNGFSGYTWGN